MARPRLLDLFCGAGGCSVGYHRAGFDVIGVDHKPQPRYPHGFIEADALDFLRGLIAGGAPLGWRLDDFDTIHASPPCQAYSIATICRGDARNPHPDLLGPTRELLAEAAVPWVIENVGAAPMRTPAIQLCGLMFDLKVFRHRWFEGSFQLLAPPHPGHRGKRIGVNGMVCVAGHGGQSSGFGQRAKRVPADHRTKAAWSAGMGIDWMSRNELAQAIPPAYTEFVGRQLLNVV